MSGAGVGWLGGLFLPLALPPAAAGIPQQPPGNQPWLNPITGTRSDTSVRKSKSSMENLGWIMATSQGMCCLLCGPASGAVCSLNLRLCLWDCQDEKG